MRLHARTNSSFNYEGAVRNVLTMYYRELADTRLEIGAWTDEKNESFKEYIFSKNSDFKYVDGALAGMFNAQKNIKELCAEETRLVIRINRLCKKYAVPATALAMPFLNLLNE